MTNVSTLPPLIEGYGRKRKKRTSIETTIKLTLEKRFMNVSLCYYSFIQILLYLYYYFKIGFIIIFSAFIFIWSFVIFLQLCVCNIHYYACFYMYYILYVLYITFFGYSFLLKVTNLVHVVILNKSEKCFLPNCWKKSVSLFYYFLVSLLFIPSSILCFGYMITLIIIFCFTYFQMIQAFIYSIWPWFIIYLFLLLVVSD